MHIYLSFYWCISLWFAVFCPIAWVRWNFKGQERKTHGLNNYTDGKAFCINWSHSLDTFTSRKFCAFKLHLGLQICVNMANSTQFSGVVGRYLGDFGEIMISFHILNRDWTKGRGTWLHGETLYFSFHQKWSKLGTLLQENTIRAELKINSKFLTVCPVLKPSFDSTFCWKIAELRVLVWNNALIEVKHYWK